MIRASALSTPAAVVVVLGLAAGTHAQAGEDLEDSTPVVGGPCEGCEAVFQNLPAPSTLEWAGRIAPPGEPGESMRLEGVVYGPDGEVAPGVIVYAYHTDAEGVYPDDAGLSGAAARHGRLRGWVRTDSLGRYRFDTIRPASYPGQTIPAHVHMHIIEPGRGTYWIDSVHFADDPLLTPEDRQPGNRARGGPGVVQPTRGDDGAWRARRDIYLGRGVPGYPARVQEPGPAG
jgi:hypothetical protein